MDDIKNDPRFAHIASDPRFRSMPKSKRKVKIDSRFQSLFTNKHFSHRTDIDKRGRPVQDLSKKNKHVMQRFYELSDDESDEDESGDDTSIISDKQPLLVKQDKVDLFPSKTNAAKSKSPKKKTDSPKKKTDRPVEALSVKKARKRTQTETSLEPPTKRKRSESSFKPKINAEGLSDGKAKKNKVSMASNVSDEDDSSDEDDNEKGVENNAYDSTGDEVDDSDEDDDKDSIDNTELPEFTSEYALEETEVDHKWNELNADATQVSESTHRLAVCNMDWDFVKAQDLFVLFKSFVPEGGHVKSIAIYPSEFGKERMAEEAKLGPREIRKQSGFDDSDDDDREESAKGKKRKNKKGVDQQQVKRSEKEKEAAQTEKLREYQLNRLRYYYAVVDCDCAGTADMIYSECDGREYLLSSVRLDLRFIPDDMTFDDEPKDSFSENQTVLDYQPSRFTSTALSQAKVDVTWDETDFDRLSKRISNLQQKELENIVEENKYADIIAPPESDSEDEDGRPEWLRAIVDENEDDDDNKEYTEEEKIQMYRKLLMDKVNEEEEQKKKEEGEFDKEIEWQPGLKSSVEKKIKKREKKQEENAIVGEYLEKRKEKKKKKKEKKKMKAEENEDDDAGEQAFSDDEIPDDFDMDEMKHLIEGEADGHLADTSNNKKKKKNRKKSLENGRGKEGVEEEEMNERDKAELELMLMDDSSNKKLSKPVIVETEELAGKSKKKKKKNKLAKLKKTEEDIQDFALDVNDPRFAALYTSHHYHIDPTAPQFKKTKNMLKLVDEQIKRKSKPKHTVLKDSKNGDLDLRTDSVSSKSVSQALVESLKRKMKK